MQKTLNILQRDMNISWFTQTMGYVHKEIANHFITVQKDEGIQPATEPLHFLFTLSQSLFTLLQSLSHNHTYYLQCYNTIQYHTQLYYNAFSFIGEIPWENTTVNPISWVHKTVRQQTSQKHFSMASPLNPKVGE